MYDCIEVQPLTEMPKDSEDDSAESDVVMNGERSYVKSVKNMESLSV